MTDSAVPAQPPQPTPQPEPSDSADASRAMVPLAESIRHRRRAQQAESQLAELQQQLAQSQAAAASHQEQLASAQARCDEAAKQLTLSDNRLCVERMLNDVGVVDVETAAMLLSGRIDLQSELQQDDLLRAVDELLADKPFLRAELPVLPPATASPRSPLSTPAAQLSNLARCATSTGDRRDVTDYLRLRRQTARA